MDNKNIIFNIDHRTVTEGDVVEITWQCNEAESVVLTIDNGFKKTDIPLETSGSKKFRLNRSKGRTHLIIAATIMGKTHRKKLSIKVKKIPTVKAETVDHNGHSLGWPRLQWQKFMTKCHDWQSKTRMALMALPEKKQHAVKMLGIIGITLMLSAIWPGLYNFVMILLVIYLLVILFKR